MGREMQGAAGARGRAGFGWLATAAIGLAAALLAGCAEETNFTSENEKEVDLRLGLLEPSKDDRVTQPTGDAVKSMILRVTDVELGTTRQGRMLTAYGETTDSGWYFPELVQRNDGRPGPDGFIEYDFLAADPVMNGLEQQPVGTPEQRQVRALTVLFYEDMEQAVGLRVNAESGPMTVRFLRSDSELPRPSGG